MIGFEPIAFLKYRIYSPGPLHHRSRTSKFVNTLSAMLFDRVRGGKENVYSKAHTSPGDLNPFALDSFLTLRSGKCVLYYPGFYQLCYRHSLPIPGSALINSQMF